MVTVNAPVARWEDAKGKREEEERGEAVRAMAAGFFRAAENVKSKLDRLEGRWGSDEQLVEEFRKRLNGLINTIRRPGRDNVEPWVRNIGAEAASELRNASNPAEAVRYLDGIVRRYDVDFVQFRPDAASAGKEMDRQNNALLIFGDLSEQLDKADRKLARMGSDFKIVRKVGSALYPVVEKNIFTDMQKLLDNDNISALEDHAIQLHINAGAHDMALRLKDELKGHVPIERVASHAENYRFKNMELEHRPAEPRVERRLPSARKEVNAAWTAKMDFYISMAGDWAKDVVEKQVDAVKNGLTSGHLTESQALELYKAVMLEWRKGNAALLYLPSNDEIFKMTTMQDAMVVGRKAVRAYALKFGDHFLADIGINEGERRFLHTNEDEMEEDYYTAGHLRWASVSNKLFRAHMGAKKPKEAELPPPAPPPFFESRGGGRQQGSSGRTGDESIGYA